MAILASQSYNELSLGDTNSDSLLLAPVKKSLQLHAKGRILYMSYQATLHVLDNLYI